MLNEDTLTRPEHEHEQERQEPQVSAPHVSEATGRAANKYADPLDLHDDDDDHVMETIGTPSTTHTVASVPTRAQNRETPAAHTTRETATKPPLAAVLQSRTRVEEENRKSFSSGQREEMPRGSRTLSNSNSLKNLSTEAGEQKDFIAVEVTTDGVTRLEKLDPWELARLYAQQQAALRSVQGGFDILHVPDWVRLHPLLGSYVAEAFGTFACVLTLSLVSVRNESTFDKGDDTNMTFLPIGFMFMCMVFTFGYVSGGHFNPAVTLAVFLVRKLDLVHALGYVICQTGASLAAGLVAMAIQGSTNIFVPHVVTEYVSSGIFSELIFTFAIATVVLNLAYSRQSGSFFYGFAFGMTVAAGSAAVGRISGGAFNPAAATGLQLALCLTGNCDPLGSFWVYWMAPLVGSVFAAFLYSQMSQPEDTQALSDAVVLRNAPLANHRTPLVQ